MTSPLLAQGIPAPSNLSSGAVVEPLALSPAIGLLATLKPLSSLNIVPLLTLVEKTASVFSRLSSPSMTSPLSAQRILVFSTLLSGVVVESSFPPAT